MNRDKTLGLLLATACFAGGLEEAMAQEWLWIHYTNAHRNSESRAVNSGGYEAVCGFLLLQRKFARRTEVHAMAEC